MRLKIIFIICGTLIVIFSLLYFCTFHLGLSKNSNDWGNFGGYFGAISNLILSFAVFCYTYSVDKKQQHIMSEERVYKLLMIISESLTELNNWYQINSDISTSNIYEKGSESMKVKKQQQRLIPIKILSNYKATQIMVKNLFDEVLPDVNQVYETEEHFKKVYQLINK